MLYRRFSSTHYSVFVVFLQEVTKKDEHQLMLSRLEWELEQRKQYVIYPILIPFKSYISNATTLNHSLHMHTHFTD